MSTPTPDPSLVTAIEALLHSTPQALEQAAATLAQEAQPVINSVTTLATAAEPAVAVIDPPAAAGIAVGVAVLNALEAMNGWLGLVPDGQAKQGIQTEMTNIRSLVSQ